MSRMTLSQQLTELQARLDVALAQKSELQHAFQSLRTEYDGLEAKFKRQLAEKDAEHAKKLQDQERTLDSYRSSHQRSEAELEQAHAVLDGVEGAPAREYEKAFGTGQRNVVTRLAGAFLAIAKGGVK